MWDKELEATKILKKEKEVFNTYTKHKDGSMPTPKQVIGYTKESLQQADYYQWAINSYPALFGLLFHIANEGDTAGEAGAVKGAMRMAMGVVAGVPDFECLLRCPSVAWCEIKLKGGKISDKQIKLHEKWKSLGWNVTFCDNFAVWRQWVEMCVKAL